MSPRSSSNHTLVALQAHDSAREQWLLLSELRSADNVAELVNDTFVIRNTSDADVVAILSNLSCSCLKVTLDGREIHRGARVRFAGNTSRRIDLGMSLVRNQSGTRKAHATFSTESGDDSLTTGLTVHVRPDVTLTPGMRVIPITDVEQSEEGVVDIRRVWRADTVPREIMPDLRCHDGQIRVADLHETSPVTQLADGLWQQTWQAALRFSPSWESNDATEARSRLHVDFEGIPDNDSFGKTALVVFRREFGISYPDLIHFGALTRGEARQRRILLVGNDEHNYRLLSAHGTQGVSATIINDVAAQEHWIDLKCSGEVTGEIDSAVVIRTTHPATPEIRIPVKALVRPKDDSI